MPDTPDPLDLALHHWQRRMHADGDARDRDARRLAAQLRRCQTDHDARRVGGLYRVLHDGGVTRAPWDWQVLAVRLLPHVKTNTDTLAEDGLHPGPSFARLAATPPNGSDRPPLSDRRFRRLIEHDALGDLAGPLVRALRLTDGAASLARLTRDLRAWSYHAGVADARGNHPRTDWAHAYYTTLLHA